MTYSWAAFLALACSPALALEFSPDSKSLLVGRGGKYTVVEVSTGKVKQTFDADIAIFIEGGLAYASNSGDYLRVESFLTTLDQAGKSVVQGKSPITQLVASRSRLCVGYSEINRSTCYLSSAIKSVGEDLPGSISALSPDGSLGIFMTPSLNLAPIWLYNFTTEKQLSTTLPTSSIAPSGYGESPSPFRARASSFSPDGKYIAVAYDHSHFKYTDTEVVVFKTSDFKEVIAFPNGSKFVLKFLSIIDIVTPTLNNVRILNGPNLSRAEVIRNPGNMSDIRNLALSPDGKYLAIEGRICTGQRCENATAIIDAKTGKLWKRLY